MIANNNIKKLIIPLLGVLLLLAPCSVRNYLQASLDLEVTKPLIPNKTVNAASNCSIWENAIKTSEKKAEEQTKEIATVISDAYFCVFSLKSQETLFVHKNYNPNKSIPYYILYKRLKIYNV